MTSVGKRTIKRRDSIKTVPPFFRFLPAVTAFAFPFAFYLMAEQIGFNQSLQRIIADFALIELNLAGHLPVLSY
ncbi:hypothetical protein NEIELOOT_00659 [Neisseria elongata subsp. glycolytica ATCC 29315]|uniref:Uncharacterized protein n=1 Tax=Neisseria elongata subsp. glycolytica ATCC 29315 TaxID=546263 RepID=D4DNM6_NEIEG|nr:hypothetical protein NEIELOOT_00659 [Neisseria elongata subsp. glycolytica ATCC 29315]